jgi:hypothetical protein
MTTQPKAGPLAAAFLIASTCAASSAVAAPLSYTLDLSDRLGSERAWIEVTIGEGTDGAIDFSVEPLPDLLARAGERFELRAFAFNSGDVPVGADNLVGLPTSMRVHGSTRLDGFGRFDVTLLGNGPDRVQSLKFSIVGIDGDTPASYVLPSSGTGSDAGAPFAARVRGLFGEVDCTPDRKCTPHAIPTAFVAASAVPVPAAAWLVAPAVLAAARFARRRR